jgi:hypothetical protein
LLTQTIASDVHDRLDAAGIRFASPLDGLPCYALFEGRARLHRDGENVALTDPAPEPVQNVSAAWQLRLEPAEAPAATGPERGLAARRRLEHLARRPGVERGRGADVAA